MRVALAVIVWLAAPAAFLWAIAAFSTFDLFWVAHASFFDRTIFVGAWIGCLFLTFPLLIVAIAEDY
jgi:hypothetical protein